MNILITSGGTAEKIDNVRSIVNSSTGRLGCAIAEAFAVAAPAAQIFYVCGKSAVRPKSGVNIIEIEDVESLAHTVYQLLKENTIDIIIHAMAVSDYRIKSISAISNGEILPMIIPKSGKIASGYEEIVLHLERAPKIIGIMRLMAPKAIIIGFKLLSNVPNETLIDVAHKLLMENGCNLVLANDTAEITEDTHKGYLINRLGQYSSHSTKAEIAKAIVTIVLKHGGGA